MQSPLDTHEHIPFDHDVETGGSYVYTRGDKLSSLLAMARQSRAISDAANFTGTDVIDIGCGDGAATIALYDDNKPNSIIGIDPAANAIAAAQACVGERNIRFAAESAYDLPHPDQAFDIAYLRGVLHHMDHPARAVSEAARVARMIVILEPNGYNPVLKLIEKTSRYHREHGEKSYAPKAIDRWLREAGLKVVFRQYSGLVPYFCPNAAARALHRCEFAVERTPFVRAFACGTYVCVGKP